MVDDFTAESLLSGLHRFYEVGQICQNKKM